MNYEIIPLPKDRWKGTAIPLVTRSDSYYDFELSPLNGEGCTVSIVRKTAEKEIVHTPEEYDFPDSLYQDHWEGAEAYGVVSDAGELMACIEVCPEEWSNRLMVTELWVSEVLRGKDIGKRLMDNVQNVVILVKLFSPAFYIRFHAKQVLIRKVPVFIIREGDCPGLSGTTMQYCE